MADDFTIPDFVPMLRTMLSPSSVHREGCSDYLDENTKESFRKTLINEYLPRIGNLKRYEAWYLNYYLQPYMNSLTRNEFLSRWADVQDNLTVISEDNKIGPGDVSKNPTWMIRFSELLAESQFRGGLPSNKVAHDIIIQNIKMNHFRHPDKSVRELPYIFKFGKLEHLRQMKEESSIRLANSNTYLLNTMNHGQMDDENKFTFTIFPELFAELDGQTGLAKIDPIRKKEIVKITHQEPRDYFMWCAAHHYDFRIPHAFHAEGVAIITEPRRFRKEVISALKHKNMACTVGKVRYFDPYLDMQDKLDVRFSKHFRFSYQNEFRVVAQGKELPDYTFIKIPNLSKYCLIHELV